MSLQNPAVQKIRKFHILNFTKTSGIVAGTPFEVFDLEDVEILGIYFLQDNTTPQANNLDHDIDNDGETMLGSNLAANDNQIYTLRPSFPGGAGPSLAVNPQLTTAVGLDTYCGHPGTDGVDTRWTQLMKGHRIVYEVNFDTIGAAQEFHCDVYYWKWE
jgi:hypothetical protein